VIYKIIIERDAAEMLKSISDRRIREKIRERIRGLKQEPEKQGKPLSADMAGYRAVRAVGQRYRIIYQIVAEKVLVIVIALGIRKEKDKSDIYNLARRVIRLRLLEPPDE